MTEAWAAAVSEAIKGAPRGLDLREAGHLDFSRRTAERFLSACPAAGDLDRLQDTLLRRRDEVPLGVHLAAKLARSRQALEHIERMRCETREAGAVPLRVTVVFAMYREHERILPLEQNVHGEDFLIRKIEQLEWLFGGLHSFTWRLIAVDDGCPDGSGRAAQEILRERAARAPVRVLFLESAIRGDSPAIEGLESTDDSRKGGSIQFGMWTAASEQGPSDHIIAFTDADLSTHLGQLGLLIEPILLGGSDAAIGSRREPESVVVKGDARNERGKKFIALWKQMLPLLGGITDTQCGFKAWRADAVLEILPGLSEHQFAFDVELLIKTELRRSGSITRVPIAWIDSEAASTTPEFDPYLGMLKSIAAMYRRYLPAEATADAVADRVERATTAEDLFG
ncbi:MAG: hypothetical protein HKP01_10470 [Gemmatimonadetes bacterium]|nr:hypothetical protein [Gemmatimonadota bacterium]